MRWNGRTTGRRQRRRGFTLIEILVATLAFAVLLAALQGVLFSALKLRREAAERIQTIQEHRQAARWIERDLAGGLLDGKTFAPDIVGEADSEQGGRSDYLEFYTTTGRVTDTAPWGEVQRVVYSLATPPARGTNRLGRTLVRALHRNLLGEVDEPTEVTRLLSDVASFEVSWFDGTTWQDEWDSTQPDDTPPEAVRVSIRFVEHPERDWRTPPLEILVPWTTKPLPEKADTEEQPNPDEGGDAGGNGDGAPGGGGGGGGGPQPPTGGGSGPAPGSGGRQ